LISSYFRHESIIDIDFILTKDSEMFILDINPRFGGGYPFTHKAGVNLPACIISWLKNEPANPSLLQMRNNVTTVKGLSLHSMEEHDGS
jgi:carbamoyl-phosphate synthase large subunit